jgi:hypothetical protein
MTNETHSGAEEMLTPGQVGAQLAAPLPSWLWARSWRGEHSQEWLCHNGLLEFGVSGFGFLQDWDFGVGVLP